MASVFGGLDPSAGVNYCEHPGQAEIQEKLMDNFYSEAPASIVEIIASRGWGKTLYFVCSILVPYLEAHPFAKVMWVAPNYQTAMAPIDDVFKGIDELTGERYVPEFDPLGLKVWEFSSTRSGPELRWWNGATVVFRSAESPDSIVSRGFNLIIMDEAALIQEQVFTQQILGTARKKGIKIFMVSTPRGKRHWTYKIFLKGQDPKEAEYLSFQQSYTKNPYFSDVLKRLIKDIPDWLRRQEYEAEFIEDGDSVLRGLDHVIEGEEIAFESNQQEWSKPIKEIIIKMPDGTEVKRSPDQRTFIAGLDLAKSVDYTVLVVMDMETGELVYYRRLNKEDYRRVLTIASEICAMYNGADLIFDATGVGQGLADMLNNYDVTAHPFVFTNDSKVEIVNKLILSVEYQEIRLPNIVTMKNELAVFTYTLTRTGKISYNAPPGFHDDIVMALAMANWYRKENTGSDSASTLDEIINMNNGFGGKRRSIFDEMAEDND